MKLRWFTLMGKEITFDSFSLIFVLGFYMGYFYVYCIEHLFFNFFNKNVPFVATNKLKFCLSVFIISNSIFLLQNFYQCFDYCSKTLSYTIDRCPENYSPGELPPRSGSGFGLGSALELGLGGYFPWGQFS